MKNIIVIFFLVVLSGIAVSVAAEEFRLVVKPKNTAPIGMAKPGFAVGNGSQTIVIKADSKEEALSNARKLGLYSQVELDYVVTNGNPVAIEVAADRSVRQSALTDTPNDPEYSNQVSWFPRGVVIIDDQLLYGSSDILKAVNGLKPKHKVRVGVIDGGFGIYNDVTFNEGYDFISTYPERPRSANYLTADEDMEANGFGHGLSVAGIIGAKTNNNDGIAGIVPSEDLEIVAAQALYGGKGVISDVADAINWMVGNSINGVPSISSPVDAINMSLSGKTDGICPSYLQEAIDNAYKKNVVVVAAGNDSEEAELYAPANCEHVITVGAVTRMGDKSDFSNYGKAVDIVAQGSSVVAPGPNKKIYWWDGTSQATPAVVGSVLLAKMESKWVTVDETEALLKLTAAPTVPSVSGLMENDCENGRCGAGILDTKRFIAEVRTYMGNANSYIKHVLNEDCDTAAITRFETHLGLCEMFEITMESEAFESGKTNDAIYQIYEVPADKSFTLANAEKVLEVAGGVLVTKNYQFKDAVQYGYIKCENGICTNTMVRIGAERISKPTRCL